MRKKIEFFIKKEIPNRYKTGMVSFIICSDGSCCIRFIPQESIFGLIPFIPCETFVISDELVNETFNKVDNTGILELSKDLGRSNIFTDFYRKFTYTNGRNYFEFECENENNESFKYLQSVFYEAVPNDLLYLFDEKVRHYQECIDDYTDDILHG